MMRTRMDDLRSFLEELKRRKVVRAAIVYALVAWAVVEVASVLLPALQLPAWTLTFVVVLAILGFPLVLALAWVFEVPSKGVRRTSETEGGARGESWLLRPAGMAAILLVALGLVPNTLLRLRRARILESLGEEELAADLYRQVEERWAGADPELFATARNRRMAAP